MHYNHTVPTGSLYLHWPFCPYKCHYCPFVALASQDNYMEPYHKALIAEIAHFGALFNKRSSIETIFLGGGTPSTMPDHLLLDTFATLRRFFEIEQTAEISIEVNPGTVRKEQIALFKSVGINRMSVGVQSLKDQTLKKLNRHQSAADVFRLLELVEGHIDNVSVDLILGLPDVSSDEWKLLLETVVKWPIKHISIYFLTVHEDTPLYFKVKENYVTLPSDETMIELYYWSIDFVRMHGFNQYEISNFAREGFQSRHNSIYWHRKPYKAFGLGACSFDGSQRFQNEKNLLKYMQLITSTGQAIAYRESLTKQQIHTEKVMLGIRQSKGVLLTDIMEDLDARDREKIELRIAQLLDHQLVEKKDNRLALTPRGLAVENEIAIQLSL